MHLTFLLLCNTDASDVCAIKITYLLTYLLTRWTAFKLPYCPSRTAIRAHQLLEWPTVAYSESWKFSQSNTPPPGDVSLAVGGSL